MLLSLQTRPVGTSGMDNLQARAEINDAWTSIVLADACLVQGKYKEAESAMLDAELHYRKAQSAVSIKQSGSILNSLADLRVRLYQIRAAIKKKSGTLDDACPD
jgi:hypothetical protein